MIDNGQVKNQADLARKLGVSRARVTQILNLLILNKDIIRKIEQIGDPIDRKVISERELRKIIHLESKYFANLLEKATIVNMGGIPSGLGKMLASLTNRPLIRVS